MNRSNRLLFPNHSRTQKAFNCASERVKRGQWTGKDGIALVGAIPPDQKIYFPCNPKTFSCQGFPGTKWPYLIQANVSYLFRSGRVIQLVRAWGLEPQRRTAREPKSRMSANSIMPAGSYTYIFILTSRFSNVNTAGIDKASHPPYNNGSIFLF